MSPERNFRVVPDGKKTGDGGLVPKKTYHPPTLRVYGRIERATGGGSGMAKESFAMETFRFP